MKMNYIGVLVLCVQLLWGVQAKSDCPKECTCVQAAFGGSVAHCKTLTLKQNFSNSVQHLNVTNSLPDDVFYLESKFFQKVQLEDIQSIKIINSSLSFIDENAFAGMDNLNFVDLSDNLLVRIHPNTFRSNNNLQQLSLSGNILELPLSPTKPNHLLESLTLKNLDLSRCQLRQITNETLSELPNLVTLNLESNYIHFLSSQVFEKLEFLEEINLSNNLITDIDPELFVDVEDLTTLKLSHNSISKFDDVDISSLVELDLSYNSFKTLESTTLEGTQDITNLNFSNNNIAKVNEDTFTDLNRLRYVDISHNSIVGPLSQFLFETNEDLETLSIAHNPELGVFEGFKGVFNSLYRLDISYCGLKEVKEEAFESLQHVSTLDLSGNELTELGPSTFLKLTRLNNLDLSDNQLTKLDEDLFRGNMDLRKLSIKGNRIHHLPARLFQPVIHLSNLDVSDCHLTYLWNKDETVYMKNNNILSQISHINLSNNKFKTLHKHNFASMSNLKSLDISKNSFQCDENFMLFVEWLVQEKKTPARYVGKSSADMVHEHAELHWSDMLAKVCSGNTDIITKENKIRPVPNTVTGKSFDRELINEVDDSMFKKADLEKDIYVNNLPEIEYTSNFGLIPETAIKSDSPNEKEYPWVWSMFLVLVCGLSILLALFNLTALLLYRTGSKYKSAGYRSTFVTPLSSHLKIRRDAGSLYHKLYEECSVPNTVPPMKNSDSDFVKSAKKNTIILSGATKGEDMV